MLTAQRLKRVFDHAERQPHQTRDVPAEKFAPEVQIFENELLDYRPGDTRLFDRVRHGRNNRAHRRGVSLLLRIYKDRSGSRRRGPELHFSSFLESLLDESV